jgi:hypothetical protein
MKNLRVKCIENFSIKEICDLQKTKCYDFHHFPSLFSISHWDFQIFTQCF